MSITITPLIVPPRTPALQPQAFLEPSWTNGKRSREDEDGTFDDAKRPRICPPLADALAFLASDAWPTELYVPSTPSSTTDTDSHSENNLDMTGTQSTDSISDGVSDSSSPPIVQTALSSEENYKFESDDDLLAWVLSLPVIDDELGEGDSLLSTDTPASPSTRNIPASPPTSNASASLCPSPLPIFSVEDDRISTQPTGAQLLHYIPPPTTSARKVRGSPRRNVDTEDLRKNVVNNLRWQWFFASETPTSPAFYERDLPPCETPGTPPGSINERTKLEPPANAYRYALDPDSATSSATRRDDSDTRSADEDASGYSASELFGPDADTVKVSRCAPVRPRAVIDLCELATVEHTLRRRADEATAPSSTVEVYADPCAVEFWKASANEVVEHVRAQKAAEETARLDAELRAFFEDAAAAEDEDEGEDDSDMEAVEIPDRESEAEAEAEANPSFDAEDDSTGSESSGEEEDGGLFDYGQWVADCVLL